MDNFAGSACGARFYGIPRVSGTRSIAGRFEAVTVRTGFAAPEQRVRGERNAARGLGENAIGS